VDSSARRAFLDVQFFIRRNDPILALKSRTAASALLQIRTQLTRALIEPACVLLGRPPLFNSILVSIAGPAAKKPLANAAAVVGSDHWTDISITLLAVRRAGRERGRDEKFFLQKKVSQW